MSTSDAAALDFDVTAAMQGDSEAFDRLVGRYASLVCAIALAIVRNVEASEDVAQEVFLAAWRGLKKLRNPASFLPWLRQVTRNRAREWVRTHAREVSDDDLLQTAIDDRLSPADSLLRDEERELLAAVIDELPDDAREVIILYYREGSSARHVAELLGIREEAVKQRLSRARSRIREEMMRRFGTAVARTAPGAAFTAAVGVAIASVSPSAAAAVVMSESSSTHLPKLLIVLKGAGIGGAAGVAGVLIGMRHAMKRARTDEQRAQLRRFTAHAVTTVILAAIGLGASSFAKPEWLWASVVWIAFVVTLGYLYRVRLPRIVAPIRAAELSEDPAGAARRHRREEIWSRIGFIGGVVSGTVGLVWGLLASG